ncbi:hypothetical protein ACWEPL_64830 [Nonomuraea sp. NPDC004186]
MTANPPQASSLRTALRIVNAVLERETSGRAGFDVARLAHEVGIDPARPPGSPRSCDTGACSNAARTPRGVDAGAVDCPG